MDHNSSSENHPRFVSRVYQPYISIYENPFTDQKNNHHRLLTQHKLLSSSDTTLSYGRHMHLHASDHHHNLSRKATCICIQSATSSQTYAFISTFRHVHVSNRVPRPASDRRKQSLTHQDDNLHTRIFSTPCWIVHI